MAFVLACADETPVAPSPFVTSAVAKVEVTAPRQVLSPGDTLQLTAQAFDAQGRVLPTAVITWSSSNPSVTSIGSTGLAIAIAEGTTTVTASSSGQSGSADIVVSVVQLCECTSIVDSTTTELVQRNDTSGVYVFRVLSGQPAIDTGSIIVGAEDGGFLRRVESVSRSGDLLTINTTVAYLDEAVESGDFLATTLTDGEAAENAAGATRWGPWTTTYIAPGVTEARNGLCCSLNGVTLGLKSDSGARLPGKGPVKSSISGEFTIKQGDIDFLPRLELASQIRLGRLESFRVAQRGGLELNLDAYEIKITAGLSTDNIQATFVKDSILYIKQKPFATFIGPMPLVGLISYQLNLKVVPTVSGSVVFGGKFRTGFGITTGVQWSRSAGWSPVFGATSYFDATVPQFQGAEATASVKIALVPEVSVQFYGAAGPKVELEPYVEAAATAGLSFASGSPTGFDWETRVSAGLNLNIGAKISILGRIDLAEATFGIPIIKPYKLVRDFSDGPLTVHTRITGEDPPAALSVQLRPAFVDTLPPWGRDLATSNQAASIPANDSTVLQDIRSGTSYKHALSIVELPGNCTFGPPRADTATTPYVQPVDTLAISSKAFIALGAAPATDTLKVECIPLGNLRVRTRTTGRNPTSHNSLTLARNDKAGAGKGTPPITLTVRGGPGTADTVIGQLVPLNAANGSSGGYTATLVPGRRNCAVAKPASNQATITSGDTVLTEFAVTCVALGFVRGTTQTVDPDVASPSDPVTFSLGLTSLDDGTVHTSSPGRTPSETLGANDTMVADSLVPLYNASGASGRHLVNLSRGPNRCDNGGASRPVTVFPGDTAHATFAIRCVERLHVATESAGPGSDRDGFMVVVANADGSADSLAIATSDTIGIAGVTPGEHVISLAGVDDSCIAPAPVRRVVSGRDSTLVSFSVNCPGPAAPAGLRATLVESARIDLAWNPAPTGGAAVFYRLYRTTAGVPGSEVVVDAIPALSYSDNGLPGFTRFSYQVAGVDDDGVVGPRSGALIVRTRDGSPPSAPSPVVASPASPSAILVAWGAAVDPETGIARYRIYRAGVLVDSTTATSWRDTGLSPNTTYSYEVLAVNSEGLAGPLSQPAKATTLDGTPPSAPIGLTAVPAGATRIDLAWIAASDAESGIASYRVYRDGALVGTTNTTTFDDTGLLPATLYTYTVSAVNGSGLEGPLSAPASAATAAAPAITGNLSVTVQTSGTNVPTVPFQVQVSAGSQSFVQSAGSSATVVFSGLTAQPWGVLLQALPAHCAVVDGANPRAVLVPVGSTASTTFLVTCR